MSNSLKTIFFVHLASFLFIGLYWASLFTFIKRGLSLTKRQYEKSLGDLKKQKKNEKSFIKKRALQ